MLLEWGQTQSEARVLPHPHKISKKVNNGSSPRLLFLLPFIRARSGDDVLPNKHNNSSSAKTLPFNFLTNNIPNI